VLQALAHVGKDNLDNDQIRSFASRVRDKDMRVLRRARAQMPGWMSDAILKIDRERDG
jgi:hypothetical protein